MAKPKYIKTPEKLWELFEQYRDEVKSNPRKKHTFVGKDGRADYEELERPLIISGFRSFCHKQGFSIEHYFANTDGRYEDYRTICSRINDEIKSDQIDGGMCGQYNPSITQRLNGLTEKVKTEHSGTLNIPNVPDIGNRE